jgi:hypothetical protein
MTEAGLIQGQLIPDPKLHSSRQFQFIQSAPSPPRRIPIIPRERNAGGAPKGGKRGLVLCTPGSRGLEVGLRGWMSSEWWINQLFNGLEGRLSSGAGPRSVSRESIGGQGPYPTHGHPPCHLSMHAPPSDQLQTGGHAADNNMPFNFKLASISQKLKAQ